MPKDNIIQLSLFDNTDSNQLPLPLLVAREYGFKLSYHEDGNDYWYAIQDWIAGINSCDISRASNLWQKMLNETVISIHGLDYTATDGKTYQRPHTNDKGLYDIAAHMRATKARPILAKVKDYLAKAGVLVDQQRLDPEQAATYYLQSKYEGKPDTWIEARVQGIFARNKFTAALRDAIINIPPQMYAMATEVIHLGLLERTTKQLRSDLDITLKQNPRDYMGEYALIYLRLAENIAADKLGDSEQVTEIMAIEIIRTVASMIHEQYQATSKMLGRDLVTNRLLLSGNRSG